MIPHPAFTHSRTATRTRTRGFSFILVGLWRAQWVWALRQCRRLVVGFVVAVCLWFQRLMPFYDATTAKTVSHICVHERACAHGVNLCFMCRSVVVSSISLKRKKERYDNAYDTAKRFVVECAKPLFLKANRYDNLEKGAFC